MRMLVCVKNVPASEAITIAGPRGSSIEFDGSIPFSINKFDEFAVEESLKIAESISHTTVDAITVGPASSAQAIRRAIGMGAHHGIHVTVDDPFVSPMTVAYFIAVYARSRSYDLVLTGMMSEDGMHGQVGPVLSGILDWPCATSVIFQQILPCLTRIYVEREIEAGMRHCIELRLPAVVSVQTGINNPRYPSLSNVLKARKAKIETIQGNGADFSLEAEKIVWFEYPTRMRQSTFLEGTTGEKAVQLAGILAERSFI